MKIVVTTPLPAVDRPNADRWNATRSRQNENHLDYMKNKKNDWKNGRKIFFYWSNSWYWSRVRIEFDITCFTLATKNTVQYIQEREEADQSNAELVNIPVFSTEIMVGAIF